METIPTYAVNHLTNIVFILSCLVITSIVAIILFYRKQSQFTSSEPNPEIQYYDLHDREGFSAATTVNVGLFVRNFHVFDVTNNQFVMNAIVWFEFNPSVIPLSTIEKFSFEKGVIKDKSLPVIKVHNENLLVEYTIQVEFATNLDYRFFPFDDHRIYLVLTNLNVSPQEVIFISNKTWFTVSDKMHTSDKTLVNKNVEYGYAKASLDKTHPTRYIVNPRVLFFMDFTQAGIRKIQLIFLPIFVILFLGLVSLSLPPTKMETILLLSGGSITALMTYRFVIERIAPKIGYFTITDHIYNIMLTGCFLTVVVDIIQITFGHYSNVIYMIKSLYFIILQIGLLSLIYYFAFHWHKNDLIPLVLVRNPKKAKSVNKKYWLQNLSLKVFQNYAIQCEENPPIDNKDWLNPDYSYYHKDNSIGNLHYYWNRLKQFLNIKPKKWSVETFISLLYLALEHQEPNLESKIFITKKVITKETHFIVFGNLQGAFHSFLRDINELIKQKILDDNLKILKSNYILVFDGNVIGRSAFALETLSLVLILMITNPKQIFYIQGNREFNQNWHNYQMAQELLIRCRAYSTENIPFDVEITKFFATLPIALYIVYPEKNIKNIVRISSFVPDEIGIKESQFANFLLAEENSDGSRLYIEDNTELAGEIELSAMITGTSLATLVDADKGLMQLPSVKATATWSILSCPTTCYQKLFDFYYDAFTVLTMADTLNCCVLTSYYQDVRTLSGFKSETYSLIYGIHLEKNQCIEKNNNPIILGTTLDLDKSAMTLGNRLREGLSAGFMETNRQGGLDGNMLKLIALNDHYTPYMSRNNILKLLNKYKTPLIITPLGTPTLEAYLPLVQQKKVLVLFPYSGAEMFRSPELTNIVHYRTSHKNEARALINFAINRLGIKRFALFYQNDSLGRAPLNATVEILHENGLDDYLAVSYERNNPVIHQAAEKIIQYNPNGILFFSMMPVAIALVRQLNINFLVDKTLFGISILTDVFRRFLRSYGLEIILSQLVPNIHCKPIPILEEYKNAMNKFDPACQLSQESFEAYINAAITSEVLSRLQGNINPNTILHEIESFKNYHFKGLKLNFDPATRELSKDVWVDQGFGKWIYFDEI